MSHFWVCCWSAAASPTFAILPQILVSRERERATSFSATSSRCTSVSLVDDRTFHNQFSKSAEVYRETHIHPKREK